MELNQRQATPKNIWGLKLICGNNSFGGLRYLSYLCVMKLRTKLNELTPQDHKYIVGLTVKWCREFLGENNRRKTKFKVFVGPQPKRELKHIGACYGHFDCLKNKLSVFPEHNKTVKELIQTTIHEYTHYTQPIRSKYYTYDEQYGYQRNPFEVVARRNEGLYKVCWKNLKQVI